MRHDNLPVGTGTPLSPFLAYRRCAEALAGTADSVADHVRRYILPSTSIAAPALRRAYELSARHAFRSAAARHRPGTDEFAASFLEAFRNELYATTLGHDIVRAYEGVVRSAFRKLASRGLPTGVTRADLMQEGMIELLRAAGRYKPEKAASFSTYAEHCVSGVMLNLLYDGIRGGIVGLPRQWRSVPKWQSEYKRECVRRGHSGSYEDFVDFVVKLRGLDRAKVRDAVDAYRRADGTMSLYREDDNESKDRGGGGDERPDIPHEDSLLTKLIRNEAAGRHGAELREIVRTVDGCVAELLADSDDRETDEAIAVLHKDLCVLRGRESANAATAVADLLGLPYSRVRKRVNGIWTALGRCFRERYRGARTLPEHTESKLAQHLVRRLREYVNES